MTESKLFELIDFRPTADPVHVYTRHLKSSHTPIVIDNGSYQCRVGWANHKEPLLQFKNLIAKPRKERGKKDLETQIGNDITNIEAVRFQLRTQFDRDVVTHFEAQEQILDHIFSRLGVDTEGKVDHPIVMTETILNPNFSRNLMNELLFECYGVPGVAYGVDALLSWQHSAPASRDALIVRLGHQCCHVIPVLDGAAVPVWTRRLNIGGFHVTSFLHRLLQLRNPLLAPAISLSRAEDLLHRHCRVGTNFMTELAQWETDEYYRKSALRVQLPFTPAPAPSATASMTPEQQQQRRKDLAKRLGEMNARKREERLAEDEEQLIQLLAVQEMMEDGEDEEFQSALESHDISSSAELGKAITQLQVRIKKTKQKIVAAANPSEEPVVNTVEQLDAKTSRLLQEMAFPKEPEDLDAWIADLKKKRQQLLDKKAARKQRRQDMAKRRTAAGQERMRIISQLARKDKRDDNFGMRDEDWDVYKVINKDGGDTDSEEEGERLAELEEVLRRYAPELATTSSGPIQLSRPESYQLLIGTELIRVPELLFQPSMTGHVQGGVAETIEYILKNFDPDLQARLANNVFVTGGGAQFKGIMPRLQLEMQTMRPFGSSFNVCLASRPAVSAWLGARELASSSVRLKQAICTKAMYEEKGGEYLVTHSASNPYWPSITPPPPQVMEVDVATT